MAEAQEKIGVDAALVKQYEAAAAKGEKAEAAFLLKLFGQRGKYADIRKLLGKGPGWTERRLDKLTGSHPTSGHGRQRNGVKEAAAKAAAKSPAKKAAAKEAAAKEAPARQVQAPAERPATRRPAAKRAAKKTA